MSQAQREPEKAGLSAEELNDKIHSMTAAQLISQLEEPECSPGILQCALRFLKDNHISALPLPASALEKIKKKLTLPYPRMSDAGTEAETSRPGD